jgi:hypothetical protein
MALAASTARRTLNPPEWRVAQVMRALGLDYLQARRHVEAQLLLERGLVDPITDSKWGGLGD